MNQQDGPVPVSRRNFLRGAAGAAAIAGGAGAASAQEDDEGGATVEVSVVNYAFEPGTEEALEIPPGTTVHWVWETDGHNIQVREQPADADWAGHEAIENTGFEYDHTFEVEGEYHYVCVPHEGLDMIADILVTPDAPVPGEGPAEAEGGGEIDIHEVGVPFQAHFVGIATVLMIVVSLVFTFFTLKYGESPNASSPGRE